MRALRTFAAVAVILGAAFSQARAQDIVVHVPSPCRASAANFDARVRSAVVARPASERAARVAIERHGKGYRVTIQAHDPRADLGTKRLITASCDEAVAAAIAVLALALSDTSSPEAGDSSNRVAQSEAADPRVALAVSDTHPPRAADVGSGVAPVEPVGRGAALAVSDRYPSRAAGVGSGVAPVESAGRGSALAVSDRYPSRAADSGRGVAAASMQRRAPAPHRTERIIAVGEPSSDAPRLRQVHLALRAGVDSGTLAVPTGYVSAAASLLAGPLEWRALLGFGLPYQEHDIDIGHEEFRQGQFAWLDLGGCYGWGTQWRFAACGAGELSVIHQSRSVNRLVEGGTVGRLYGVLAAHLAYRQSRLQPELELAALAAPDGSRAVFRASLGLGMPF